MFNPTIKRCDEPWGYDHREASPKPSEGSVEADGADPGGGPASDGGESTGGDPLPPSPRDAAFVGGSSVDGTGGARQRRSRWLIVVAAVVVVLIVVGGVVIVEARMSGAISTGSGTATFTWTSVSSGENSSSSNGVVQIPPQPFTGEINRLAVSGVSTTLTKNIGALLNPSTKPSTVELFQCKGSFDGKPFNIGIFVHLPGTGMPTYSITTVIVKGTYNGDVISGVVSSPSSGSPTGSQPAHFRGTIGDYKVSGVFIGPAGSGPQKATATFTVTK